MCARARAFDPCEYKGRMGVFCVNMDSGSRDIGEDNLANNKIGQDFMKKLF